MLAFKLSTLAFGALKRFFVILRWSFLLLNGFCVFDFFSFFLVFVDGWRFFNDAWRSLIPFAFVFFDVLGFCQASVSLPKRGGAPASSQARKEMLWEVVFIDTTWESDLSTAKCLFRYYFFSKMWGIVTELLLCSLKKCMPRSGSLKSIKVLISSSKPNKIAMPWTKENPASN